MGLVSNLAPTPNWKLGRLTSQNDSGIAACPICQKQNAPDFAPFCSKRCANVDLNRWLSGGYAIPASDQADDEDDPAESQSR
ncbi:MAG: DNA gyrase inhibitor YacG [Parvularculaceae bacterium]